MTRTHPENLRRSEKANFEPRQGAASAVMQGTEHHKRAATQPQAKIGLCSRGGFFG